MAGDESEDPEETGPLRSPVMARRRQDALSKKLLHSGSPIISNSPLLYRADPTEPLNTTTAASTITITTTTLLLHMVTL